MFITRDQRSQSARLQPLINRLFLPGAPFPQKEQYNPTQTHAQNSIEVTVSTAHCRQGGRAQKGESTPPQSTSCDILHSAENEFWNGPETVVQLHRKGHHVSVSVFQIAFAVAVENPFDDRESSGALDDPHHEEGGHPWSSVQKSCVLRERRSAHTSSVVFNHFQHCVSEHPRDSEW